MKGFTTIATIIFLTGQISARDSKLSQDCLTGVADKYKCCNGVPDSWYAHLRNPENCSTFYQCEHGEPTLKPCPEGLEWNVNTDQCEWPESANCIVTSRDDSTQSAIVANQNSTYAAQNSTTTSVPARTTYPEYYTTTPPPPTTIILGESTSNATLTGQNYTTTSFPGYHTTTPPPPTTDILEASTTNATLTGQNFTTTSFPVYYTTTSPPPTTDIPFITSTTYNVRPTPIPTSPPVPEDECAPEPVCRKCLTGVFPANLCCQGVKNYYKLQLPNPNNCATYFQCIDDKAVLKSCPRGLHWCTKTDRCEWPVNANCKFHLNATSVAI